METQEATTVETTQEQTTSETTAADVQPETTQTTEQAETQKPAESEAETTATSEQADEKQETVKNWEQIAKDNQASFTRVSQELAELKKQVEAAKPKLVQEGKINPEFEQRYRLEVDNREFLAYDNLSRQLEPETRQVVETLLNEAKRLYNPTNKRAYEAKMAEIKDYFRADIVEQIALEKKDLNAQMQSKFDEAMKADRMEKAQKVSDEIQAIPELYELVNRESENFSEEVFGIVKTMFDFTGGVDVQSTLNAINKIKALGVKEYQAKQQAEKERAAASVPTGTQVVQKQSTEIPSRDELIANPKLYREAVKKFGMDKVDSVIMKG